MAAPTVVGVASNYVFGTSLPVATPAGVAVGDRLFAWIHLAYNTPVVAAPSGWTLCGSINQTSGTMGGWWYLYERTAALGSGDLTTSYTWTAASQNHWGAIVAVRGASGINVGGQNANFGTVVAAHSLTIPAITPTVAETLILAFYSARSNDTTPRLYTQPTGMTEVLDRADNFAGLGIASLAGVASGVSTGTKVANRATGGTAPEWGGVLLAVAPTTSTPADAGADQTGVEPGATVTLTGTGTTWTQTGGSPSVTLAGSGTSRTFTAPATLAGTTLTFENSGSGLTADTMTVTILPAAERIMVGGSWVAATTRIV